MKYKITEIEKEIQSKENPIKFAIDSILDKIEELQNLTNSYWIVYWGDTERIFSNNTNLIVNEDIEIFRDMLMGFNNFKKLFLDITSPGGRIDAAESIITYLKSRFESIEIVVPFLAKSAATLLCLSAKRIYMGDYSFLGSITPLVGDENKDASQVLDEVKYYENMIGSSFKKILPEMSSNSDEKKYEITEKGEFEDTSNLDFKQIGDFIGSMLNSVYLPLIKLGYPIYEAENALKRIESVGIEILKQAYKEYNIKEEKIKEIIHNLLFKNNNYKLHSKNISKKEAREMGLKIEDLEKNKEIEEKVLFIANVLRVLNAHYGIVKFVAAGNREFRYYKGFETNKIQTQDKNVLMALEIINKGFNKSTSHITRNLETPKAFSSVPSFEKSSFVVENRGNISNNEDRIFELIQLEKMQELWDNEEDEFWDTV
ncbi:MAG: hypothetical protein ACTSRP_23405 [Candidatus Helarchaeota archaeon]